jgi:hypothetical protein
MTYSRSDSTFTAGNKFLMSAKTWYLPDDAVVGAESDFSTPAWNTEVLNDVSPTGSDVLGLNQKYTTTIRGLNLGTSPNHADPKRKMMIQVCRQSTGAGGRTDSLPATIRITDAMLRWTTGSRVTSTVGTTAAGTSVTVATVHGAVNNSNQKIIILGAGAAGANYVGTVASFSGTTLTVSPATVTSVPADTLVAFEASLFDFTWNFTGTGPDAANGTGGGSGASQLWDDVREWTATNGTACNISGVNLPVSSVATCSVNAGADPESGIQFPDNSSAANCVYLRTKGPPTWDSSTAPSLLLTAAQIGAGTGNILFRASTWSIQEGVTYNSPSYVQTDCTVATGAGDLKKQTIVCPDLSITGAAAGRAMKIRICRAGTSDSITVPVKIFESAMRWTITNACPAP